MHRVYGQTPEGEKKMPEQPTQEQMQARKNDAERRLLNLSSMYQNGELTEEEFFDRSVMLVLQYLNVYNPN